jgi:hypothetical protein
MGSPKTTVEDLPADVEQHEEGGQRDERDDAAHLTAIIVKRRRLELAKTDVLRQLELARAEAHREMLHLALQALQQELDRLI